MKIGATYIGETPPSASIDRVHVVFGLSLRPLYTTLSIVSFSNIIILFHLFLYCIIISYAYKNTGDIQRKFQVSFRIGVLLLETTLCLVS